MIKQYIEITKPKIIFGNLLSVIGGFSLASDKYINFYLLFFTIISILLVIASSCVFNNIIDVDIDKKMERTKNRVLVKGIISKKISFFYATVLGIVGILLLYIFVNPLSMLLAIVAFIIYIGIYTLYLKRKSIYATIIGSISGATPPVIGYCSVSNKIDIKAIILCLIFISWQIPHSYAISILRFKDYQMASIPVLPVKLGILITKYNITIYIVAFIISIFLLSFIDSDYNYFFIIGLISILWLIISLQGYHSNNDDIIWSRKLLVFSIIILVSMNIMLTVKKLF